jgi:hypothetical protein
LGDKYGFIETESVFKISFDFTVSRGYSERAFRAADQCARATPKYGLFSGFLGDTGPSGSYIDWKALDWKNGKPACKYDPRWSDKCSSKVVYSPDKPDDIGVMLTQPAAAEVVQSQADENVGCGRIRIAFNCSNFTFESCVVNFMQKYTPESMYSNYGE